MTGEPPDETLDAPPDEPQDAVRAGASADDAAVEAEVATPADTTIRDETAAPVEPALPTAEGVVQVTLDEPPEPTVLPEPAGRTEPWPALPQPALPQPALPQPDITTRPVLPEPASSISPRHETPRRGWWRQTPVGDHTVLFTLLAIGLFLAYLLIEPTPRWLALLAAAVALLGTEGLLRIERRTAFEDGGIDVTPFLFLPALYALTMPVFLEENLRGWWTFPAGLAAGLGLGAVAVAEVASVRERDPLREQARFFAAGATYLVAFALYSLTYSAGLEVRTAIIATGLMSALLAVELLREHEVDQRETLILALAAGLVLAELRWGLHYLPLDGHLAALALLFGFYFVTGILAAHLTRALDALAAVQYGGITAGGVALVVAAHAAGLG